MPAIRLSAWAALAAVVALSGCGKKVDLVFYNATTGFVEVTLDCSPIGPRSAGTVDPYGTHVYTLRLEKKQLPAECSWHAVGLSGQFAVTQETPERLYIYIEQPPAATEPAEQPLERVPAVPPKPPAEPAPVVPEEPLPAPPVEPAPATPEQLPPGAPAEDV